ncbi:MAG: peptidase S9 family protein, partial [Gammaproteobacteria bacterium]|nr:peptidase S9 family protein [Gammaproteobacteria bacterium]
MNKNFLLITLFLLVSPSAETKENINHFDAMDIFDLEWASDPQVSSDGETIVYVRKSNDIMKDRVRSSLWRITKEGRDHRPLNS